MGRLAKTGGCQIVQAIQLDVRIGYNMGIKQKEMLPMQERKVNTLTGEMIREYAASLRAQERAEATIEKYLRDIRAFACWLKGEPVAKETAAQWKEHLLAAHLSPTTVNAKLSAVNGLFRFLGWGECRVKFLKVQRKAFRDSARELKKEDYTRLVAAARRQGREWLDLAMETMCGAGLRVSEIKYITVETARAGRVDVALKGKIRTILLPGKLARKLEKYAKKQKIASGVIFRAGDGMPLNRFQIWRAMKALCREAGVEPSKVFPHNLRHLFATAFYQATKDIVKLADVLGHSSIDTTRIYLMTTGEEHARCLERLGLVS